MASGEQHNSDTEVSATNFVLNKYSNVREKRKVILFKSTVNGYHHFRIRPLVGVNMPMYLVEEDDNVYDANAICVKIPDIEFFNKIDEHLPTKDGQTVKDVAGKICGRVPRKIASILKGHITCNMLTHAHVFSLGTFTHVGPVGGWRTTTRLYLYFACEG